MINLDLKQLMRLKKTDLIQLITNLSEERDAQYDRAQNAIEELNDMETYEEAFHTLEAIKDIMERIKDSRWKLSLGNLHEQEEIDKLMEKLEETILC